MAAFTTIAAVGLATAGAAKSAIDAGKAKRSARETGRQLELAEQSRQEVINPYEGVSDLSSMISNPFANLQVATKASEMQARETDISLASTLDAVRAFGGGSATALAQAASRAKQGVAASIEQQEAQNARLRAQGEQQMQQMKMAEAQRLQQAEVAGQQFMFQATETRQMQRLNRLAGLQANYQQQQAAANAGIASSLGAGVTALGSIGGA